MKPEKKEPDKYEDYGVCDWEDFVMGYNQACNDWETYLKSRDDKLREALEFAKKKRTFEGTPRMCFDQAFDALQEICKVAKEALKQFQ